MTPSHAPVLLAEVTAALQPRDGAVLVDGTFGRGGYARALLDAAAVRVIAIDRDPDAIAAGAELARRYAGRLTLHEGRFSDLDTILHDEHVAAVDGVALDLGVSSPQLDDPERGFSFRADGPLDMRMEKSGVSAADVVNAATESELAETIARLGEERHARRVARAIVAARREAPITRTLELAEIVRRVVPRSKDGIDPATRTFQALRLRVNGELEELDRGLAAAERVLSPGGRLAVVSFHSLEDRAVKHFLRERSGGEGVSRHMPQRDTRPATFTLASRKPIEASAAEIARNPRARSARLRVAERTAAPAWAAAQVGGHA
ncbi:MAG: 16S rRNA (cytosine(1402)-N(4))-methyltransferase RsmH [Alphaproteobacteria bacterium]|nr:16S rRNA (cytosine(1402)-N(4))-methyltransferase RsmH [Alphaproteobacteria bacterium]